VRPRILKDAALAAVAAILLNLAAVALPATPATRHPARHGFSNTLNTA
jgi:hypothetical protein